MAIDSMRGSVLPRSSSTDGRLAPVKRASHTPSGAGQSVAYDSRQKGWSRGDEGRARRARACSLAGYEGPTKPHRGECASGGPRCAATLLCVRWNCWSGGCSLRDRGCLADDALLRDDEGAWIPDRRACHAKCGLRTPAADHEGRIRGGEQRHCASVLLGPRAVPLVPRAGFLVHDDVIDEQRHQLGSIRRTGSCPSRCDNALAVRLIALTMIDGRQA
jgi:hypothetical protein